VSVFRGPSVRNFPETSVTMDKNPEPSTLNFSNPMYTSPPMYDQAGHLDPSQAVGGGQQSYIYNVGGGGGAVESAPNFEAQVEMATIGMGKDQDAPTLAPTGTVAITVPAGAVAVSVAQGGSMAQAGIRPEGIQGHWRDGLCDCFRQCVPTCCLATFCGFIGIGQLLTRTGMSHNGSPLVPVGATKEEIQAAVTEHRPFRKFVWIVAILYIASQVMDFIGTPLMITFGTLIEIALFVFLVATLVRITGRLRARDSIPGDGCGDCCQATFCHCCVIARLLRHTNNYAEHPGACCSEDGL